MERDGATLVGMTGMPEAALARELELPYAAIAVVVNHAAGRGDSEHAVSMEGIARVLETAMDKVRASCSSTCVPLTSMPLTAKDPMIRDVLRMGDPRLLQPSAPVDAFGTAELDALLADLRDTMAAQNGAGLAAPQIGVPPAGRDLRRRAQSALSGCRAGALHRARQPGADAAFRRDGGGLGRLPVGAGAARRRAAATRACATKASIRTAGRSAATSTGFHARVVQHECDHLLGILYPMRMRDFRSFGFTDILFPEAPLPRSDGWREAARQRAASAARHAPATPSLQA